MLAVDFTESKAVNLARYKIKSGEYLIIVEGFAMRVHGEWFAVDGYLKIDGVLAVGILT